MEVRPPFPPSCPYFGEVFSRFTQPPLLCLLLGQPTPPLVLKSFMNGLLSLWAAWAPMASATPEIQGVEILECMLKLLKVIADLDLDLN